MFRKFLAAICISFSLSASATVWSDLTPVLVVKVVPDQGIAVFQSPAPLVGTGLSCGTNNRFSLDLTKPGHGELYAMLLTALSNNRSIVLEFDEGTDCAQPLAIPVSVWIF